jgi:cysteine synthase
MSDEERAIAASTDGYRMGAPPSQPVAPADVPLPAVSPEAASFVDSAISNLDEPVVMFSLEWCEFCWALHKFFRAYDIPYRSVDLDSVAYQKDNIGGEIRKVLHARLGSPTIPQVFVGGRPIGGCTDVLEQFGAGTVHPR